MTYGLLDALNRDLLFFNSLWKLLNLFFVPGDVKIFNGVPYKEWVFFFFIPLVIAFCLEFPAFQFGGIFLKKK